VHWYNGTKYAKSFINKINDEEIMETTAGIIIKQYKNGESNIKLSILDWGEEDEEYLSKLQKNMANKRNQTTIMKEIEELKERKKMIIN